MKNTRFVRCYLRASTTQQNAERAKKPLIAFAADHGHKIASFHVENESGATLHRPKLMELIADAGEGDIILVEQIDRLARLQQDDWETLKMMLTQKKLLIVSPELPTSWGAMGEGGTDSFTASILQAVNAMLLDMLAAVARKDYEDRRRRQLEGIEKAKAVGKYKGKQPDHARRRQAATLLNSGASWADIQSLLSCSKSFVASVRKDMKAGVSNDVGF